MKHDREHYTRKMKYKQRRYDEGERRRGRERDYEEIEDPQELKRLRRIDRDAKRKEREEKEKKKEQEKKQLAKQPTSSLRRPESLRPPSKVQVRPTVKRSADEIRMIKEDIARRFREGLNAKGTSNQDSD